MPRWKALPEELDPEVSEFTLQLRALVDRSGLSIAAVGDRTGYSKTSWERYLNGRLLAPKGAIVALAEVTGTHQQHLITMWELAERAWSRSEMRHDMTMEAIRISQARQALGEFSPGAAGSVSGPGGGPGGRGGPGGVGGPGGPGGPKPGAGGRGGRPPAAAGATIDFGAGARGGRPGAGPGSGAVPQQRGPGGPRPSAPGQAQGPGLYPGQSYGGYGPAAGAPGAYPGPARPGGPAGGPGGPGGPGGSGGPGGPAAPGRGRRRALIFGAAVVGALVVAGGALLTLNLGGDGDTGKPVAQSPSPSPVTSKPVLPDGVKCSGDDCTGEDPEEMGCGGQYAETVSSATVGTTLVEVRYSKTCGAAWARITQAAIGDEVRISSLRATGEEQTGVVETTTDAYTPMAAVPDADSAKACATLVSGTKGCTTAE
ncbi:XRE family transcriptional regulator [Streptomyces paludis]|uniref:XRE family transcriptional regulator n=1 Tax=Streptomyces paludis TaxID=2282738 RepID=A0A345HSY2_9ACTN|nr:XRE family transcriptional regulator [Streptomyces paludis]AXG79806.1 XRE family transcriptional regulator [Streptomyces paludis]